MATIVGTGDYKVPHHRELGEASRRLVVQEVGAVGCDQNDNVVRLQSRRHPMMVFDRNGSFLRSWGEGLYPRGARRHMGPDESIT